jgi:hypothetical protein
LCEGFRGKKRSKISRKFDLKVAFSDQLCTGTGVGIEVSLNAKPVICWTNLCSTNSLTAEVQHHTVAQRLVKPSAFRRNLIHAPQMFLKTFACLLEFSLIQPTARSSFCVHLMVLVTITSMTTSAMTNTSLIRLVETTNTVASQEIVTASQQTAKDPRTIFC